MGALLFSTLLQVGQISDPNGQGSLASVPILQMGRHSKQQCHVPASHEDLSAIFVKKITHHY